MDSRTLLLVCALFLLLLAPCALGATLKGTIYHDDLTLAKNVIVTIDTQPQQRLLSLDGTYEFMVPKGGYVLRVLYLKAGFNETHAENVTVAEDGTFTYDLFLLPGLENEESLYRDVTNDLNLSNDLNGTGLEAPPAPHGDGPWPLIVLIVVVLILLIVPLVWMKLHFAKLELEYGGVPEEEAIPDERLEQIIALLRKEGGRMTQKELRAKLPDSEAKVSLMISELEHEGKVARIKKGRGNIIVLKK